MSQTLKHVVRCTPVSVEPACGSMTTRVYEYSKREQTDGKLTLSEFSAIKIIDG